jgi:hypothetical protein
MKRLFILALIALLAGPAAGPAHAQAARTYTTPDPVADPSACPADIACEPELEGAPESRPRTRVWSVRTRGAPPEEVYSPTAPVAIIADVDVDPADYDGRRDRDDRPRHPPLRRDEN